jgi:hypothetical protein
MQDRFFQFLNQLIKWLMIFMVVRAFMLLMGIGYTPVPVIDDLLYMVWHVIGEIVRTISGSSLLPRF